MSTLPKRKRFLGRKRSMSEEQAIAHADEIYPTDTEDEEINGANQDKKDKLLKNKRIKKTKTRKPNKGARMK